MTHRAPTAHTVLLTLLLAPLLAIAPAAAATATVTVTAAPAVIITASDQAPGSLCEQRTTGGSGTVQDITATCGYTGAEQYLQTPTVFGNANVTAAGGSGGDSFCSGPDDGSHFCAYGGRALGAGVSASLPSLTEGTFYQVRVGGRGSNNRYGSYQAAGGWNGGGATTTNSAGAGAGGGGATDLRATPYGLGDRLVVAGAGGGAGNSNYPGYTVEPGFGGAGGPNGDNGRIGGKWVTCIGCYEAPFGGGTGGTQTAGGVGGPVDSYYGFPVAGGDGSLGQGGAGAGAGGGGGGGYYGGGGGNGPDGGGGGGGSSLAPSGATVTTGNSDGNGKLTISYRTDSRTAPGPTCTAGSADTAYQTAVTMDLSCQDPTGKLLLRGFTIARQPAHGTATIADPAVGRVAYTPAAGFAGTDTFTYRNTSANGEGDPMAMTVTVAHAVPTCHDVSASGVSGAVVTVDCDSPGNPVAAFEIVGPAKGSISYGDTATGSFGYSFPDGFVGTEDVSYRVFTTYGPASAPAKLHLVAEPPPLPTCQETDTTTRADTAIEPLSLVCGRSDAFDRTFAVVTPPAHGKASITSSDHTASAAAGYVPDDGFEGTDTFTYAATNYSGAGAPATVTIHVGPPTQPVTCDDAALSLYAGQTTSIAMHCSAAAAGFTNAYYAFNGPGTGTLGTIDRSAGTVPYTAPVGFSGTTTLQYSATNGTAVSNGGAAWATVTITVKPVPVPTCQADPVEALVDTAQTVALSCATVDGHPQTYAATTQSTNGKLTGPDPATGATTYTPDHGYRGSDSFTVTSTNDIGVSTPLVVVVTVRRPPVTCADATVTLAAGTVANARLSCSEADAITVVVPPEHGTLSVPDPKTGVVTYTPDLGFFGTDSFTYRGTNPDHESTVRTGSVSVAAPGVPTCRPVTTTKVLPGSPQGHALSCDSPTGFPVQYAVVGGPAHGTVTGFDASTGTFGFSPQPGFRGTDGFNYTAQNASGTAAPAVVEIEVDAAPNAFVLPEVGQVAGGRVTMTFRFPFQGWVRIILTSATGKRVPLRSPVTAMGANGQTRTISLRLNAATLRTLAEQHRLRARLTVRYRPDGSTPQTQVTKIVLRTRYRPGL